MDFFIHAPPPGEVVACADHDLHSLYSVCLRELEKNQQKLNKNKKILALSCNFLGGHCLDCIKYSEFYLSIAFH